MREGTQGESSHLFLVCARFRTRRSSWAARPPLPPPRLANQRIAFLTLTFRANAFSTLAAFSSLSRQGQKARSGGRPRLGFEGGQTPIRLRLPKRGFHNPHRREYQWLNLYKLSSWIRQGRIDPEKLITMKTLRDSGVVGKKIKDGVKLLGAGHKEFSHKISIEVSSCSALARESIERQGGQVQTVYYNKLGLKALLKPGTFDTLPFPARPPPKLRHLFEYVGRLGQ